ncbi:hypothetical protein UFOVP445_3 [uncultured Caudovirales phage]|uniref:Gp6 domain containing protein n=1 Tax=uncultured Caudovirales phage TaxID=2100421 RepID=A0A6J5MA55_9CAUD|nr:hypothetical protein UFOVP445_3 [uncultured Caudovirales phage]
MSVSQIVYAARVDNFAAVQTLTLAEVQPGDTVTVAGVVDTTFNGTVTVISIEPYELVRVDEYGILEFDYDVSKPNQIIYADTGANVVYDTATGTVTYTVSVTWTTSALVLSWLGIDVATANDTAFVAKCVSASNYWCFRKRREAGYTDAQGTVPSPDVELAATMYAATLYRERGTSGDSYGGFDGMGNLPMPVTLHRIMQLLGCGRAQVA